MQWVWTDELMQRLEIDEPQRWVPLIAYRVDRDEDVDRLAQAIGLGDNAGDVVGDNDSA